MYKQTNDEKDYGLQTTGCKTQKKIENEMEGIGDKGLEGYGNDGMEDRWRAESSGDVWLKMLIDTETCEVRTKWHGSD